MREAFTVGAVLLLAGCAAAPPWRPPATHPTIAVASVLNPYSSLYVSGQDAGDDNPRPAKISFDVNRQLRDALHADLAGTSLYKVVDMDVDPGVFAISKFTQRAPSPLHPRSPFTLDSDLTDLLVDQAKGKGADYVVVAVDIHYQHTACYGAAGCALSLITVLLPDSGWGLHFPMHKQCDLDTSVYLNYYVFVIDVASGNTVASLQTDNDRYIRGLDIDHQDLSALPAPQKAEIGTDLEDMVQKSVNASLMRLNLQPGSPAATTPAMAPCATPAAKPAQAPTGTSPR
ncbi:MAG TPA: hypothetical protein VGM16_06795 [Gammaproteobacteria bacterium]